MYEYWHTERYSHMIDAFYRSGAASPKVASPSQPKSLRFLLSTPHDSCETDEITLPRVSEGCKLPQLFGMRAHIPQQRDASARRSSVSSGQRVSGGTSLPMPRAQSRVSHVFRCHCCSLLLTSIYRLLWLGRQIPRRLPTTWLALNQQVDLSPEVVLGIQHASLRAKPTAINLSTAPTMTTRSIVGN
jgi:hypothetical protein